MKVMKKAGLIAFVILVGVICCSDRAGASSYEVKYVTTENGAKLKCHSYDGEEYCLDDIVTEKEDIIIPETVDGEHKITALSLAEYSKGYYKKVKHIHLSRYIEDIYEKWSSSVSNSNSNILRNLPNLSRITVDSDNVHFMAWDGKIYKKNTWALLAIAPNVSGTIVIEKNVKRIVPEALLEHPKVNRYLVEKGNASFKSVKGVLYKKNGKKLLAYPIARKGRTFSVPSGVSEISPQAFEDAKYMRKVTFPATLRRIGYYAFSGTKIQTVKLNKKLREIETGVFWNTKLKEIELPKGLNKVCLSSLPGKKLTIPENVGEIEVEHDVDSMRGELVASILVIRNPALDLMQIENYEEGLDSIFEGKTVYAYKGSLPYKQMKRLAKKEKVKVKVKVLKGKVFKTPKHTGKIDTSWYDKEKKEFYISTPAQLAGLSEITRKKGETFSEKTIILKKNLDMKKYKNFQPIGEFAGTFDGRGRTIKNLKIVRLDSEVGLFSHVSSGLIKNLKVKGSVIGGNCTGGIVGLAYGNDVVKNCSFRGKVKGYGYSGKRVGDANRES